MLRRHRGTLAVLALGTLVVALIVALGATWMLHLPHPEKANRRQLLGWLVLRDLQQEPLSIRQALVDRLQAELDAGIATDAGGGALSPAYRERLARNCTLLQRDWFLTRSRQYDQIEASQRVAFLDRQIATLLLWCDTQQQLTSPDADSPDADSPDADSPDADSPDADSTGGLPRLTTTKATSELAVANEVAPPRSGAGPFFDQLETWLTDADDQQRPVLERAVTDGLICWLSAGDLEQQPHAFRLDLAERIATSLDVGANGAGLVDTLDDSRRRKLQQNCRCLMEVWLHARAAEYQDLAANERTPFIDRQLERLSGWDLSQVLGRPGPDDSVAPGNADSPDEPHAPGDSASPQMSSWLQMSQLIEQWIEEAEPDQRKALRRMVTHLQQRLLWQQFQSLLPSRNRAG